MSHTPTASPVTVFTGGTIIVAASRDGSPVTSDALAIAGDQVIALGSAAHALARAAESASRPVVIDLAGGTLSPAFGDGHAHPVLGALEAQGPAIRMAKDLEGILQAVAAWKEAHPDAEWIVGASYDTTFAPGGQFDAEWLDAVTGDTPTVLRAWDYHTAWVNSAALAAGGITADTPDPELGHIVRRDDGTPMGTLQEAAANDFIARFVPAFSLATRIDAIEIATKIYAQQGTTWVQDAWVDQADIAPYLAAAQADRLHTRVNLALRADPAHWREQVHKFVAARADIRTLNHPRLTAETIKFFVDGVVENHTASMLSPYADRPDAHGLPNWTEAELAQAVLAYDAAGFQVHLHAIGDRANRIALDALESTQATDPARERHHVIAHVAVLHPTDIARFAKLNVIANFEPYWAQCDAAMRDLTIPHIGHDRESWQYLIGSLGRSGATVSFGSDWPVTTEDWRPALATAIARRDVSNPADKTWLAAERVSAWFALAAYTEGIARQALAPDRGTLDVGQTADLAWLSGNPLLLSPEELPSITVHGTWLAGERLH